MASKPAQLAASIPLPIGLRHASPSGDRNDVKSQPLPLGVADDAAKAVSPPPVRVWSQLGIEPTRPPASPQSREQALGTARNSNATHVAVWTPAEPRGVTLPRDEAVRKIESSGETAFLVVPLHGNDRVKWQSMIDQTTAALALADWLGDPAASEALRRERAARRLAVHEAAMEQREVLSRAFYGAIFPETQAKPAPPSPPGQGANAPPTRQSGSRLR